MYELYKVIGQSIPNDHSRQVNTEYYVRKILSDKESLARVLDLGCGEGSSVDLFRSLDADVQWYGLDIEGSPEVMQRKRTDADFTSFDGVRIPFFDNFFDLVYSNQVFEHVREPRILMQETCRVLRRGGLFIGSVSYLEPYHSFSTFNYTPYGFHLLAEAAGLRLLEVRPGIDALTLIVRSACPYKSFFSRFWRRESPLNQIISLIGRFKKAKHDTINLAKLKFCGQFSFKAQKI